jgi:hypothetical protein
LDQFNRTMKLIDEELANLDAIELRNNIPSTSVQAAKASLFNLKERMEEDAEIGKQILSAV